MHIHTHNTKRREKPKPQTFAKGSNLGRFISSTIVRSPFIFVLLFLREDINHVLYKGQRGKYITASNSSHGEEKVL